MQKQSSKGGNISLDMGAADEVPSPAIGYGIAVVKNILLIHQTSQTNNLLTKDNNFNLK